MHTSDIFFLAALAGLGGYLTHYSWQINSELSSKKECLALKISPHNRVIMILGLVLIVSTISIGICNLRCNCVTSSSNYLNWFLLFSAICGSVLVYLADYIKKEAVKNNCTDLERHAERIMYVGIGVLILGALGGGSKLVESFRSGKSETSGKSSSGSNQSIYELNKMGDSEELKQFLKACEELGTIAGRNQTDIDNCKKRVRSNR